MPEAMQGMCVSCMHIDKMEGERWRCYPNGRACSTDPMLPPTQFGTTLPCAGLPTAGRDVPTMQGKDCKDCDGKPGKCKAASRCSGWATTGANQGGWCVTGCEDVPAVDQETHKVVGAIVCCSAQPPPSVAAAAAAAGAPEMDASRVGSIMQTRPSNDFDTRMAPPGKEICWNTKRFCNHVAARWAQKPDAFRTEEDPAATFRKECGEALGDMCAPQCLKLGGLYDEASQSMKR